MKRHHYLILLTVLLSLVGTTWTKAENFIKSFYISCGKYGDQTLADVKEKCGDNYLDLDLNKGCGSDSYYIYLGWTTTTNPTEAITDVMAYNTTDEGVPSDIYTDDGKVYTAVKDYKGSLDLNYKAGGRYIYLMYSTTGADKGAPVLTSINTDYPDDGSTLVKCYYSASQGIYTCDFNEGTSGDNIILNKGIHTHSGGVGTIEASRTNFHYIYCSCGQRFFKHTFIDSVVDPTCVDYGYDKHTCSVCGYNYIGVERLLPTGVHTYNNVVTAPTCIKQGYTTHTCTGCGDTYVDSYKNPLGHDYEAKITAPTCTEQGYTTYTCKNCGDSYTVEGAPATGHTYNAVVTQPSCKDGYTTHTCTKCGYSYKDNEIPATGEHYYNNGFCVGCDGYQEATQASDGYYEISNAGQLYWFQQAQAATDNTLNARLTADIVINLGTIAANGTYTAKNGESLRSWTPICGSDSNQYSGTIDGQGHTISGLYVNESSTTDGEGLVKCLYNGTIKNLGIINSYICGRQRVGSFAGTNYGTITNCFSFATVKATADAFGISLNNHSGAKISNCYFAGTISASYKILSDNTGTFSNNYYLSTSGTGIRGTAMTAEQFASGEVAYLLNGSTTSESCVWRQTLGENGDSYPVLDTTHGLVYKACLNYKNTPAEDTDHDYNDGILTAPTCIETGHITYTCNNCGDSYTVEGDSATGHSFTVVIETKAPTCVEDGYTICQCGNCTATKTFEGDPATGHTFENGICSECGTYESVPELSSDGYYEIRTALHLRWYANLTNGTLTDGTARNLTANARLMADIDLNPGFTFNADGTYTRSYDLAADATPLEWTPIGYNSFNLVGSIYEGIFNGNGHTVSGVYVTMPEATAEVGFISASLESVSDLTIVNSYVCGKGTVGSIIGKAINNITGCSSSAYVVGNEVVGGIVGYKDGEFVLNCTFTGSVTAQGNCVGGIIGDGLNNPTVSDCCNFGSVEGSDYVGGISRGNCHVSNSYNAGEVTATGDDVDPHSIIGDWGDRECTMTNCYYLSSCAADSHATAKTAEQFASGEVAYLLNGSKNSGSLAWGQTLEADAYPTLNGGGVNSYAHTMSNEWGTLVVPFAITYDASNTDYKLYQFTKATSDALTFSEYADGTVIPAGMPMAIRATGAKNADGKYDVRISMTGADFSTTITTPDAVNGLTMKGTYSQLTNQTGMYFIAANQFWWAEDPITINPFRAWFEGSLSAGAKALCIVVEENGETTTVGTLQDGELRNGKYVENHRIVIYQNGRKYNINGQVME